MSFGKHPLIASSSRLLAIDPGNTCSAWVKFNAQTKSIFEFGYDENEILLAMMQTLTWKKHYDHLAIEMIASYGMAVGATVFDTCVWIGRFIEGCSKPYTQVYRKDVKMHLCGQMKAKDTNIRQALIDKFGPQGTKKAPGVTFGISGDVWAALGVAVTWAETMYRR